MKPRRLLRSVHVSGDDATGYRVLARYMDGTIKGWRRATESGAHRKKARLERRDRSRWEKWGRREFDR